MKKFAVPASILGFLSYAKGVFAQTQIQLERPKTVEGKNLGYADVAEFIKNAITLIFIVGTIIVLVMLVWGAVEWILSGGSKEGLDNARKKIINALIGFAILAVAFAIAKLAGQFVGIDITENFTIPTPTR